MLVVEDDAQLAELLDRLLREEGHTPVLCGTLQAAKAELAAGSFDIVILDRMLPDGDGLELCSSLSRKSAAPPTLLLTARGEVHDRVNGLRGGADDYLTKPFEVEELLARLETIHRRAAAAWLTRVGELVLDQPVPGCASGWQAIWADRAGNSRSWLALPTSPTNPCHALRYWRMSG